MKCKFCEKELIRTHVKQNNRKFCDITCRNKYAYHIGGKKELYEKLRLEGSQKKIGVKVNQCLECGLWYNKLCSHTWQAHGLTAYEYKKKHQLETTKSIVSDDYREHKRNLVLNEQQEIMKQNLIIKGRATRFKKGHHFNYVRTPTTLSRLKVLHKLNNKIKLKGIKTNKNANGKRKKN